MPIFLSDEELSRLSRDGAAVAQRADEFIRNLYKELETVKAQSDASSITAEQTCSLLEQKYVSLSSEYAELQSQCSQLQSSFDHRLVELADIQSQKHNLSLQSIAKDGEIEKSSAEVSELHNSKRQLMQVVEHKELQLREKNATIKSYLDKIVSFTESASQKDARINELEAQLARTQSASSRLLQEKELIERHNAWLDNELKEKVDAFMELRKTHANIEAEMSSKLSDVERQLNESSKSLKWNQERVKELEAQISSLQEELISSKKSAAAAEERFSAEISTANKLVDLYKESSEEWSKKAGELEGVIKALETHLAQVENDYKDKLEKEISARRQLEKDAADLKVKLEKCEGEMESLRKENESNLLPLSGFNAERWIDSGGNDDMDEDNRILVPRIPIGVSGTALAASLLRDGWSLAKMYAKYQEAVDAYRHEQIGRKEAESVLQRVLNELEEKAEIILDERAEHDKMVEAYSLINQKLQQSKPERLNLEKTISDIKADVKRREREYLLAQQEIADLRKQVTILLKECRDIQLHSGSTIRDHVDDEPVDSAQLATELDAEKIISDRLLTYRDISGLVEQNVQLRSLVRSLSYQIENKEMEFKERMEMELKKHTEEAASKVEAVLERAEEQTRMIESLHTSVAMYKRLYEEEHKLRSPIISSAVPLEGHEKTDIRLFIEGSQETAKKVQEQAAERIRFVEEELEKSRSKIISLQSERDKLALQAEFSKEKFDSLMKESEHKREEINGVLARNVEFSRLIVEYQRKLRESSESLQVAEDASRKLEMEVSVLKNEKEMLKNAEKRACDEVRSLSERVHRLQATLDTIQSAEEVREEARTVEKRKQEDHIRQLEREWVEAKKELQVERENVRKLTIDKDHTLKDAMRQVEDMGKELSSALHAVATAESRAAVAEARLSDLEKRIKRSNLKVAEVDDIGESPSILSNEVIEELRVAREEMEKLKDEAQANKEHMLQYKSIAQVNETALKQMESTHESFKTEAEKFKKTLEAEVISLKERVSELEGELSLKSEEIVNLISAKEEALNSALAEVSNLKEERAMKISEVAALENKILLLEDKLKGEHEKWRSAHANYERQVILQSETIQELTRTSEALALVQKEVSGLRSSAALQKTQHEELKAKWEAEKSTLVESRNEAEKKYDDLNRQNKILHDRLEALHIQMAEKDRGAGGISSGGTDSGPHSDAGLQHVMSYLRRSKEIGETEISLLKQEKLRLQSQLENALKAAETAQASLRAEKEKSRASVFTDEEFRSLQLQVREMSLLRESNMQLREENKHNFEECQRMREEAQGARLECEKFSSLLREKQNEVEVARKEIELQKMQKDILEKRVDELQERLKHTDAQYNERLKIDTQQLQENLKEKDTQIEGFKSLASERDNMVLKLEEELQSIRSQLSEKEKNMLLVEEKQKRMVLQFKRKSDSLTKEKEELIKEKQSLSKQLEDSKQGKRSAGDVSIEQIMKEKEIKEKRLQMLETFVEKQRENMKKEKERRQKSEDTIVASLKRVDEEKTKVNNELGKHKETLKELCAELEKVKHADQNLPQGTSIVQILSGSVLDDLAAGYIHAVENFEQVAQSLASTLGARATPQESTTTDANVIATAASTQPAASVSEMVNVPPKSSEEKERISVSPKINTETRKTGRKLVRPRLKSEDPQDVDMSEMEGKAAPSHDTETNLMSQVQHAPRKRLAPSISNMPEQSQIPGEGSSDVVAPLHKKSRGSDVQEDATEDLSGSLADTPSLAPMVEPSESVSDAPLGSGLEAVDVLIEEDQTVFEDKEKKEVQQFEEDNQQEMKNDESLVIEENFDKPGETVSDPVDISKDQHDRENIHAAVESTSEKEEGELPDVADLETGNNMSNIPVSPEAGEGKTEQSATPLASPARADDDLSANNSSEVPQEENVEDGEISEGPREVSDKLNDESDQAMQEVEQTSEAAQVVSSNMTASSAVDTGAARHSSPISTMEVGETKRTSPASSISTTINLSERARQRAALRQAGVTPALPSRGQGRAVRGIRGRGRAGRGQASGDQGQGSK